MTSDEIRDRFLSFFESRDHKRLPSGSLVPAEHDPSVLLTTAGMHPLKPYFQGREKPPHHRLTSCQKCFRTPDIDQVGLTTRHLTFFEMLGNFSMGDYFKEGAIEFAWDLSLNGFGFNPDDIWVTVFEGDEELGLGPDEEAIEAWLKIGVPRERIVGCPRSENFWQAGPTGPCGPCSELYLDRGLDFGKADDLPGGENERFLEYWNLVFMQFEQNPVNTLTPLPAQNIDTGLGLNRLAAILQGVTSRLRHRPVRAADRPRRAALRQARGQQPRGRPGAPGPRRPHARHELPDRRRRRPVQRGPRLRPAPPDAARDRPGPPDRHRAGLPPALRRGRPRDDGHRTTSELLEQADTVDMWLRTEEEAFNRTLESGLKMLDDVIAKRDRER